MSFDPDRVMAYRIPDVRRRWTRRDAALYAISVGMACDPLDEGRLRYVDPGREDFAVLPSAATIVGHPGHWHRDPASGMEPARGVHGEQALELLEDIPADADIIGTTRITGIADKGEGKDALVFSETQVIDSGKDRLVALARSTAVVRGRGGFGGEDLPLDPPFADPGHPPDLIVDQRTHPEQALVYRLNGDDNPLHADPETARRAGFGRPILHGLCTFGFACGGLVCAGSSGLTDIAIMRARFLRPVFPGEALRLEIWKKGFFRMSAPERAENVLAGSFR